MGGNVKKKAGKEEDCREEDSMLGTEGGIKTR